MASRPKLFSSRARWSATQQWTPRRPEKTHKRFWKPKCAENKYNKLIYKIVDKQHKKKNWKLYF